MDHRGLVSTALHTYRMFTKLRRTTDVDSLEGALALDPALHPAVQSLRCSMQILRTAWPKLDDTECMSMVMTIVQASSTALDIALRHQKERGHAKTQSPPKPRRSRRKKIVIVPQVAHHRGKLAAEVTVPWVCPVCNGPRGEPYLTSSIDGKFRLDCHGWSNPCGHLDPYAQVVEEAEKKGTIRRFVLPKTRP